MKKVIPFFIILLSAIPALLALFHPGFFLTDDGNWMVIRFSAFYEVIKTGQIPVRFLPRLNFGFGYPVADFLYPLFMYLGVPIKLLGVSFVNTIKILFGLSLVSSGLFSYLWLRRLFSEKAAVVGAILFMLFPYHIFDMYQRGSVGEVVALALVPLIFYFIEQKSFIAVGLEIGLLILAHNVLALLFLPILIAYMMLRKIKFVKLILTTVLGFALSAFFWLPALWDRQFTVFNTIKVSDISQYFLNLRSLILLGLVSLIVLVAALVLLCKQQKNYSIFLFFFITTAVSIFFTLPFSQFFWNILPLGTYIQFPFRFLSVTILGIAFLGSYTIDNLNGKIKILGIILYMGILLFSSWTFFFPAIFQNYPDTFYYTNQDTTTVKNEYMPLWVTKIPTQHTKEKIEIIRGEGHITNLSQKGNRILLSIDAKQDAILQINITYFPGWKVWIDGKVATLVYKDNGFIRFSVMKGMHSIKADFTETPLRLISDIVSVIAIIFVILNLIQNLFYRHPGKRSASRIWF